MSAQETISEPPGATGFVSYTLDELYRLRQSPLSQVAPPANGLLATLQTQGKPSGRWPNTGGSRRHDTPAMKPALTVAANPKPQNAEEDPITAPLPIKEPDKAVCPENFALNEGPPPGWSNWTPEGRDDFDEWESPTVGDEAAPMDAFTLGDIREAEATIEGLGVPINVYIDKLKRGGGGRLNTILPRQPPPSQPHTQTQNQNPTQPPRRQDIFFSDDQQYGQSRFLTIFERQRRQQQNEREKAYDVKRPSAENRPSGNKPFYMNPGAPNFSPAGTGRYNAGGYDDPKKYAQFLTSSVRQERRWTEKSAPKRPVQQHYDAHQKVTAQQLVNMIQTLTNKSQGAELTDRQRELLQLAAAKIKQLQAQQRKPEAQYHEPKNERYAPKVDNQDRVTAIAEALQRTLQQQSMKGVQPNANQKQVLLQVLQALQRLKASRATAPSQAGVLGQQPGSQRVNHTQSERDKLIQVLANSGQLQSVLTQILEKQPDNNSTSSPYYSNNNTNNSDNNPWPSSQYGIYHNKDVYKADSKEHVFKSGYTYPLNVDHSIHQSTQHIFAAPSSESEKFAEDIKEANDNSEI